MCSCTEGQVGLPVLGGSKELSKYTSNCYKPCNDSLKPKPMSPDPCWESNAVKEASQPGKFDYISRGLWQPNGKRESKHGKHGGTWASKVIGALRSGCRGRAFGFFDLGIWHVKVCPG